MRFLDGTGGFVSVPFARSGARRVAFDRSLFRAPFGSSWFTSGDGAVGPLSLDVSLSLPELPPLPGDLLLEDGFRLLQEDGSSILFDEFTTIEELLTLIDNSTYVDTAFFDAPLRARSRTSVVPVVQGYRVDVTLLLRDEPAFAFVIETEAGTSITTEDGRLLEVSV